MNAISQITCVGMNVQTGGAPADNEKEMEIEATAAAWGEVQLFQPEPPAT